MKHKHLFDNPKNVTILMRSLFGMCLLLVALDLVINRYTYHSWENLTGFYALYGFVGCVILVVIAKWMRTFLMRSEEYYDREELKGLQGGDNVDA